MFIAEKYLSKYTDVVIADSKDVANYLIEKQRLLPKKVVTILNGVDVDKYQKDIDVNKKERYRTRSR